MQRLPRLVGVGYLLVCALALLATAFAGPIGYAPFPLPIGPAREPVVVTIWYGTEKRAWLEDAVARYTATNPRVGGRPVRIVLRGLGSREQVERVARQEWGTDGAPTVVSPASSLWLEVLRARWAAEQGGDPLAQGVDAPAPLALTPLVLVSWAERGALIWPEGVADWGRLHDALARSNWSELGGRAEWGPVKFAHTTPLTSNSGAQTLVLLAYGYHQKSAGLSVADVEDAQFLAWLDAVEGAVGEFPDSTGDFVSRLAQFGPSTYDVIALYENLAIESIAPARRWGELRVYYPPATLLSDHPYAALDAPWVTREQREAARGFRAFLLSRPIQERALAYGFRPADPAVSVVTNDPQNPFNLYRDSGLRPEIQGQAEQPAPAVVEALLARWSARYGR
jgi:hypothetical protein